MDSKEGGIVVTNWAESSFMLEVKEKQDQDSILLYLKASFHIQRVLDFEQRGDDVLKYQGRDFKRESWRRLIAPGIPFIQVPPKYTVI